MTIKRGAEHDYKTMKNVSRTRRPFFDGGRLTADPFRIFHLKVPSTSLIVRILATGGPLNGSGKSESEITGRRCDIRAVLGRNRRERQKYNIDNNG